MTSVRANCESQKEELSECHEKIQAYKERVSFYFVSYIYKNWILLVYALLFQWISRKYTG